MHCDNVHCPSPPPTYSSESPGILRLASTNASFRGSDTVERLGNSGALSADLRVEVAFKWPMLAKGSGSSTDCAVESDAAMTVSRPEECGNGGAVCKAAAVVIDQRAKCILGMLHA